VLLDVVSHVSGSSRAAHLRVTPGTAVESKKIMSKERHVKKSAMTLAALAFAGLMGTQANAAPLSSAAAATTQAAPSAVEQVRDRYERRDDRWHRRNARRDWRSDRRYYRYRNWNRYNSRPYNYRSRGCVAVGPVWFCNR
jgi:hypothetical protein